MPQKLGEEYLDIYDGIQSEILSTTIFDENSDLSTTYLGKADMTKVSKIKEEEKFPISEKGKLLDGTECQILWIQEPANHLCPNYTICIVNYSICCPSHV